MNEIEAIFVQTKARELMDRVVDEIGLHPNGPEIMMMLSVFLTVSGVATMATVNGNETALRQLVAMQLDVNGSVMKTLTRPPRGPVPVGHGERWQDD